MVRQRESALERVSSESDCIIFQPAFLKKSSSSKNIFKMDDGLLCFSLSGIFSQGFRYIAESFHIIIEAKNSLKANKSFKVET